MATAVGGSAITITADGGTGSADSSNTGTNHIKVEYADFAAICQVTVSYTHLTLPTIYSV